jgi:SSS family solute:Na+ symporter
MMAADTRPRARMLSMAIVTLMVLSATRAAPAQDTVRFDDFIGSFPAAVQVRARAVWDAPPSPEATGDSGTTEVSRGDISDDELLASVGGAKQDAVLVQLKELRAQWRAARARRNELVQATARWTSFAERIEGRDDMGLVYLGALRVVREHEPLLQRAEARMADLEQEIQSRRVGAALDAVSCNFTTWDWLVIVAYLVLTTVLGGLLAGKQASMKDFFLGGRKLPWPAVCGSIIATELSAATFLIVPALVFSAGGDMTYIQLALGTILARLLIGYFFIPAYYAREIYSPYEYMGRQLGPRVKNITTGLFMIGGILAQGARVYIAAKALQVVTGTDVVTSIVIIGAVSIGWTVMGGITTVVWTDAIQFLLFVIGAVAAVAFAATSVDGGLAAIVSEAGHAGKFRVLNFNLNAHEAYTLWCGLIGFSFLTLASHGTDQLLVQRLFTCKGPGHARKAIVWSSLSQVLTFLLLFVGAAVFVYYRHVPLTVPERVVVDADSMKVFAVYIVDVMPPVLSGLLMAAIFAAAISTLDSLLAALSQSTISIFYQPFLRPRASDRHYVRASRVIVLIWGMLLTAFAIYCDVLARSYSDLIQFALAMAAYTYGGLLGVFLLAFLPTRRDDLGLLWGVPLSMLTVFALSWHQTVPQWIVVTASALLLVQAFRRLRQQPEKILYVALAVLLVLVLSLAVVGTTPDGRPVHIALAWPWHFPLATAMTFCLGYLVGNRRPAATVNA